ncbi:MAG TPA: TolC family protein [Vicinamibacterales bacterium]|nr:TolC family protein [Vicinamibacterales bacterium]
MRTRTWYVAAALSCVSATASSQTVLTEADALARLSADSPRVRAIRADVEVARAEVLAAGRWPNPRLTINRESVAGIAELMALVTQPLPITGRRGLEVQAASATADAASSRADGAVRVARAELRAAYADLVAAQGREAELTRARDRLRELADVLGRRETAGESAGYDRLRADREVLDVEESRAAARADRFRAQGTVAAFFAGAVDPAALVAAAPAAPRTALPSLEDLVARAQTVRGELVALRHEADSARFAWQAAERRLVPEPEIVAGSKSSNALGGDIGSVLSVHLAVPLFDRARPERAMAAAKLAQAEARAEAFQVALHAQIAASRGVVVERRESADRYRAAAEGIERLERIALVSYEAGERGILELLDAYRSGSAARVRQAELDAAARRAEIELEWASGWEIR